MNMILEILATLSAGLFAGAAIYVNLVEHPARMQCGSNLAVTEFAPSYKKGAVMQASLAVFGLLAATAAWLRTSDLWLLIGTILLGAVIPFTLIVIFPTNKKLLDPSLDKNSQLALQLLTRWGTLHAVRSFLGLASFIVFLTSLIGACQLLSF
jgi:anthrone oxygenase-like protein